METITPTHSLVRMLLRQLAASRGNVIDVDNANIEVLLGDVRNNRAAKMLLDVGPVCADRNNVYSVGTPPSLIETLRVLIFETHDGLERYNIGFDDAVADMEILKM